MAEGTLIVVQSGGWTPPPPVGWGSTPPGWEPWAPPRRPVWHLLFAGAVGLVLGAGISAAVAAALWFSDFATGSGEEQYSATSAAARAQLGTCVTSSDLLSPESSTVACDDPHATEVYVRRAALEGDTSRYPPEGLGLLGDEMCFLEFEPYVGRSYFDSSLEYTAFVPNEEAWVEGQRDIVCVLHHLEEPSLTGSSRGSRR